VNDKFQHFNTSAFSQILAVKAIKILKTFLKDPFAKPFPPSTKIILTCKQSDTKRQPPEANRVKVFASIFTRKFYAQHLHVAFHLRKRSKIDEETMQRKTFQDWAFVYSS